MLHEITRDLVAQLQQQLENLYHHTDFVFPFAISAISEDNFCDFGQRIIKGEKDFQEVDFHVFFSGLTREHAWMSAEERGRVKRYKDLKMFLLLNFESFRILKIGGLQKDIYIIARTACKDYIIISTAELKIPVYQSTDS